MGLKWVVVEGVETASISNTEPHTTNRCERERICGFFFHQKRAVFRGLVTHTHLARAVLSVFHFFRSQEPLSFCSQTQTGSSNCFFLFWDKTAAERRFATHKRNRMVLCIQHRSIQQSSSSSSSSFSQSDDGAWKFLFFICAPKSQTLYMCSRFSSSAKQHTYTRRQHQAATRLEFGRYIERRAGIIHPQLAGPHRPTGEHCARNNIFCHRCRCCSTETPPSKCAASERVSRSAKERKE